jgi:hypothetical protein
VRDRLTRRRVGHVEQVDVDERKIPADITERRMASDAPDRSNVFAVRNLPTQSLGKQIGSGGASWLNQELASPNWRPLAEARFSRGVMEAFARRRQNLVDQDQATRLDVGSIRTQRPIARFEVTEIAASAAREPPSVG